MQATSACRVHMIQEHATTKGAVPDAHQVLWAHTSAGRACNESSASPRSPGRCRCKVMHRLSGADARHWDTCMGPAVVVCPRLSHKAECSSCTALPAWLLATCEIVIASQCKTCWGLLPPYSRQQQASQQTGAARTATPATDAEYSDFSGCSIARWSSLARATL